MHDAFEMTWCVAGSYCSWLTPITNVPSGPVAGAVMMTFLAPAAMCLAASSRLVNLPVHSNTTSTPRSFQGSAAGSFCDSTWNLSPFTLIQPSPASIVASRLPRTESYLSRCASVLVSVMSLTATKSKSLLPSAARMMLRPIRPKPLMPTLMAMGKNLRKCARARSREREMAGRGVVRARPRRAGRPPRHTDSSERLAQGSNRRLSCRTRRKPVGRHVPCSTPSSPPSAALLALPWFAWQVFRHGKYLGSLASGSAVCRSASMSTPSRRSGSTRCRWARAHGGAPAPGRPAASAIPR